MVNSPFIRSPRSIAERALANTRPGETTPFVQASNAAITLTNGVSTQITFATVLEQTGNFVVPASNDSFVLRKGGFYQGTLSLVFADNATGRRDGWVQVNNSSGATANASDLDIRAASTAGDVTMVHVPINTRLKSGDVLTFWAAQNSGGDLAVTPRITLRWMSA